MRYMEAQIQEEFESIAMLGPSELSDVATQLLLVRSVLFIRRN